jgi:serine protease Do
VFLGMLAPGLRDGAGQESQPEPSRLDAAIALQDAMVEAIARAEKSVVAIARVRKRGSAQPANDLPGTGLRSDVPLGFFPEVNPTSPDFVPNEFATGVVFDRAGHIVTNYHVLGNPTQNDYYVWARQRPFHVTRVTSPPVVQAGDPWTDLAVLKIDGSDLEPMPLGDASSLRKGMIVIALGNPYGIARDGEVSASWGIISNLRRAPLREVEPVATGADRSTLDQFGTLIQTDARLDLGTSGGALVNLQGEMIGLTTSLAAMAGYEQPGGFAIPVDDTFRRTVETLVQGRLPSFGFLGVQPDHLTFAERQAGQFGARVLRVLPGTPAEAAGLQPDDVITHVNQRSVVDRNALFRELSRLPAGQIVQLTVERRESGRQPADSVTASVALSKKFVDTLQAPFAREPEPSWRGLRVDYPSALPPQWNLPIVTAADQAGTVAVFEVVKDSPAWKSGLRRGELISHVAARRVSTPDGFYQAVAEQPGDVSLQVLTSRGEPIVRTVAAP